jgi:hypothetical protein
MIKRGIIKINPRSQMLKGGAVKKNRKPLKTLRIIFFFGKNFK